MNKINAMLLIGLVVLTTSCLAMAQPETPSELATQQAGDASQPAHAQTALQQAESDNNIAQLGACLGAGVIVIGGGLGIGRLGGQAVDAIARQPEAAAQMFLAWLLPAAMIEGAMLFAVVLCLLVITG